MNKTGYTQETVENVLSSLFTILQEKPDFSVEIDFGDNAGKFISLQKNTIESVGGLLELLSAKAGCQYLSDLHHPDQLVFVKHALYKIKADRYSIGEWNDAVCYITGQSVCFNHPSEAMEYLRAYTYQSV